MKINKISATGLKYGDFSHAFEGVNVIVGQNAKGKTSVLEAVRLALAGYIPELGKTNGDTFQLCRGASMVVQADIDSQTIKRTWSRNGKGAIKCIVDGGVCEFPVVMLDPSVYFGLGDKDRIRYVFGASRMSVEWDGAKIISGLKSIKLETHTEDHERELRAIVDEVNASDDARIESDTSVQDWIEQLIAEYGDRLKAAKAEVVRLEKTTQGVTQVADDTAAVRDHTAEINEKQKALAEENSEISRLSNAIYKIRNSLDAREEITKQLADLPQDVPAKINEVKTKLASIDAELHSYDAGPVNRLSTRRNELSVLVNGKIAEVRRLETELRSAQTALDKVNELTCCPTCKAKSKGWKDAITKEREDKLSVLKSLIQAAVDERDNAQAELDEVAKQCAIEIEKQNKDRALYQERGKVQDELVRLTGVETTRAQLTHRLELLTGSGNLEELRTEYDSRSALVGEIKSKLFALQNAQRAYDRAKAEEQQAAKIQIALNTAKVARDVVLAVVQALESLQSAMVEQAFGKIISDANRMVGDILKSPLAYKDGQIGRLDGNHFIAHATFSGTEKALAYAAISVALASQSPLKLVMIDELDRLDAENKVALIARMLAMVKDGTIDQFITAGVNAVTINGVNVINI